MATGFSLHRPFALGYLSVFVALNVSAGGAQAADSHSKVQVVASPTQPEWKTLTPAQHQALQPLAATWPTLSDVQKKKWIALSSNYAHLKPVDQQKLHQRMADWAALTPKQRTQARLNYTQTQQLSPEDKAERWEVYQSLTPDQKKIMIESAPKLPLAPKVAPPASKAR